MALDYGYSITIEKDGTCLPDTPHTNQWQRKIPGGNWRDIFLETDPTYTVVDADQACDIRLEQDFAGTKAYSNVLTVTSEAPGCPLPDPILYPHIEPSYGATNGDTIRLTHQLQHPTLSGTGRTTLWYATKQDTSTPTVWSLVQTGTTEFFVDDDFAKEYKKIYVVEDYTNAPDECDFESQSNWIEITYTEPAFTWGNVTMSGPSKGKPNEVHSYFLNWDGDVTHYYTKNSPTMPVNFKGEYMTTQQYEVVLEHLTTGTNTLTIELDASHKNMIGPDPIRRSMDIEVETDVVHTLGTVTLTGPKEAEVDEEAGPYKISWTGDAPEEDVSFVWISDGAIQSPTSLTTNVKWSSEKSNSFVWAQVSYGGDYQMPQIENINVKAATIKPGTPLGGGYVAGVIIGNGEYNGISPDGMNDLGEKYYIIVAPKSGGQAGTSKKWKTEYTQDPEEESGLRPPPIPEEDWLTILDRVYGRGATEKFADSKHPLFNWVMNSSDGPRKQRLGGYSDWYVPAYYELEICLANLKPGTNNVPSSGSACCGAMGQNPHSDPPGPGYTTSYPPQTSDPNFQTGGSEAFSFMNDYKSSSQNGRGSTSSKEYLGRSFDRGDNRNTSKTSSTSLARVIRRVKVDP